MAITLLVVFFAVAGIVSTSPVVAHAELERADPPVNGLLGAPPQQVNLWFTETVDEGAGSPSLSILDENGNNLDVTNLSVDPSDRHHVAADLSGASLGTYTVLWSARSAEDGHTLSGSYTFRVATGRAPGAATTEGETPRAWAVATRWLTFLGAAIVAAGFLFRAVLLGGVESKTLRKRRSRLIVIGGTAALLATLIEPWLQTQFPPEGAIKPDLNDAIAGLPNGWWLRLVAAGVVVVLGLLYLALGGRIRNPEVFEGIGAVAASSVLLGLSLTSHASARSSWRAVATASDFIHQNAVGLWVGGLFFLTLYWLSRHEHVERPEDPIRRFSRIALVLVLTGVATGVANAGFVFPAVSSLWESDYGRILIVKVSVLFPALVLATIHRVKLRQIAGDLTSALRSTVRLETAIVAAVVLGGTVLSLMAPPADATSGAAKMVDLAAPGMQSAVDSSDLIRFQLAPAKSGDNTITIFATDKNNQPIPGDEIALARLDLTSLSHGATETGVEGTPNGSGGFTFNPQMSLNGWWRGDVLIRRLGVEDETASFYFMLPDPNVNGFDAPKTPDSSDEAEAVYQRALGTLTSLHSIAFTQRLSGGTGTVSVSENLIEDGARGGEPAQEFRSSGISSITIGDTQWVKRGDADWQVQAAGPVFPPSRWGETYEGATGFQLGNIEEVNGEQAQIVTFYLPPTDRTVAAWFAWWVGLESGHVLQETMVSNQHYMVYDYSGFDEDFDIEPPTDEATPEA